MTQAGATTYEYDANGNQTEAGSQTSAYDLANRLASTTLGGATTTYSYDGDGNRVGAAGTETNQYVWDMTHPLPQLAIERTGAGALIRRHVYGTRRISMTSGGSAFYYHHDSLGSVVNVSSSSGATSWTYAYEPFGAPRTTVQEDQSAPENQMKFTGQLSEGDGRYYLRARQYDPAVGRFLQRDPAPSQTGAPVSSSYAYVDHRPTLHVDPSGRTFESADSGQRALASATDSSLCPSYATYGQRRRFKFGIATVAQGVGALAFKTIWITAGFYGSAEYRGGHECKMLLQYGASYDTRQMAQIEGSAQVELAFGFDFFNTRSRQTRSVRSERFNVDHPERGEVSGSKEVHLLPGWRARGFTFGIHLEAPRHGVVPPSQFVECPMTRVAPGPILTTPGGARGKRC